MVIYHTKNEIDGLYIDGVGGNYIQYGKISTMRSNVIGGTELLNVQIDDAHFIGVGGVTLDKDSVIKELRMTGVGNLYLKSPDNVGKLEFTAVGSVHKDY